MPIKVNMVRPRARPTDDEVTGKAIVLRAAKAEDEARKRADHGDLEALSRRCGQQPDLRQRAAGSKQADELLKQAEEL